MPARKQFRRPLGTRRYGKRFVLATEGEQTEPRYFRQFDRQRSNIDVKSLFDRNALAAAGLTAWRL
jgi:hypothetical protein